MGIPEYITIAVILLVCMSANIFLIRWIFRINIIVGRMDEMIKLLKEIDKPEWWKETKGLN